MVEDGEDTRELLARFYRKAGCEVECATDGVSAMRAYWRAGDLERPFDLIVLDLAMPRMDGFSFAERVRGVEAEGLMPKAYIFAYTGYGQHVLSKEAVRRAAFDRLEVKTGEAELLEEVLKEVQGR